MLDFYTSMTVCMSDIRKIGGLLREAGQLQPALSRILTTPLFMNPTALTMLRDIRDEIGGQICFDSAGYYVQVGKISYDELYYRLLTTYRANPWADRYVLPDNVPCSQDSKEVVWDKVRQTVEMSCIFYQEMPRELRAKCVPVVHGHTAEQIEYCLEHYLALGEIAALGFGSFSTNGKGNGSNSASAQSIINVALIVQAAQQRGLGVHLFGLGVPALVPMIEAVGASSFDSASWLKSAGFGQVFLPFTRSYNVSHRTTKKNFHRAVSWDSFVAMRELTGHDCYFCTDRETLSDKKMYRAMHNLLVVSDSVKMLNNGNKEHIANIYANSSPMYRRDFLKWNQTIRAKANDLPSTSRPMPGQMIPLLSLRHLVITQTRIFAPSKSYANLQKKITMRAGDRATLRLWRRCLN